MLGHDMFVALDHFPADDVDGRCSEIDAGGNVCTLCEIVNTGEDPESSRDHNC